MFGQNFPTSGTASVNIGAQMCARRRGRKTREIVSNDHGVRVGRNGDVIFLARTLNFQIVPANKCRVDKRRKTVPT